ncbi:hypothetical protein D3C87_1250540 [compost metagenome]
MFGGEIPVHRTHDRSMRLIVRSTDLHRLHRLMKYFRATVFVVFLLERGIEGNIDVVQEIERVAVVAV